MPPHTELQCPYCTTTANETTDGIQEEPATEFDVHRTGVTCRDCGKYYEVVYEIVTALKCPKCRIELEPDNWKNPGSVTSRNLRTAQFDITCSECDWRYTLHYKQEYVLYWEDHEMKSTRDPLFWQ